MSEKTIILVDVDTQFDFVDPQGALYVPAPHGTVDRIRARLVNAQARGEVVLGSVDSHSWDAWEFEAQGGPFPAHCVKGQPGWLRVAPELPKRTRFVAMQSGGPGFQNWVGERREGEGPRQLDAKALADEALSGVGLYFEKEVYSLFSNPAAECVIEALVEKLGGRDAVLFEVLGYCTGGYCVDAAVAGLRERGYAVRVLADATAAIGGEQGALDSKTRLEALGALWQAEGEGAR